MNLQAQEKHSLPVYIRILHFMTDFAFFFLIAKAF